MLKLTDISEVHNASIIRVIIIIITLMMEAVCTLETSINLNVITWHYIPEDSKLQYDMKSLKS
jgi:hypothetical protein